MSNGHHRCPLLSGRDFGAVAPIVERGAGFDRSSLQLPEIRLDLGNRDPGPREGAAGDDDGRDQERVVHVKVPFGRRSCVNGTHYNTYAYIWQYPLMN